MFNLNLKDLDEILEQFNHEYASSINIDKQSTDPDTSANTVPDRRWTPNQCAKLATRRDASSLLRVLCCPCVSDIFIADTISNCGYRTRRVEHQQYLDDIIQFRNHNYSGAIEILGIEQQGYHTDDRSPNKFFHYDPNKPKQFFRRFFFYLRCFDYLRGYLVIPFYDDNVIVTLERVSGDVSMLDRKKYFDIVFDFVFNCFDFDDQLFASLNFLHFNDCSERF